jgi:multimeric flavodoxin WrbA
MKVIAFNGSPHKNGSTFATLQIISKELKKSDIETEIVQVGSERIRGCIGCYKCRELKRCIFTDDIVNEQVENSKTADGIILASPVYYAGIAGTFKCFLDRFFFVGPSLAYKAGAAIVALRRTGGNSTFHQLNNYLNLSKVILTPSRYWNVIHGTNGEEILQDGEGAQIAQDIGQNMAWLMKSFAASRSLVPIPVSPDKIRTNFVR